MVELCKTHNMSFQKAWRIASAGSGYCGEINLKRTGLVYGHYGDNDGRRISDMTYEEKKQKLQEQMLVYAQG